MIVEPRLARELELPPWQRGYGRARRDAAVGTRIGTRIGTRAGAAIGTGADPVGGGANPMASVSIDAGSGIYVPANVGEWTTTMSVAGLATGNPSLLWLCQEAAGNLGDSIGAFAGTATGTIFTYQTAIAGWSRKGIDFSSGGTCQIANVDAGLPDVLTSSILLLGYVQCVSSGGSRDYFNAGTGAATQVRARCNVTPRQQATDGANSSVGTIDPTGPVRPVVLRLNRTATTCLMASDVNEKLVPAFDGTVTGKSVKLGDATARCPNFRALYFTAFFGAAAELTDAQVKALLQTLGWSIPWT